jgi:lysine 2,3-aminomutase
MGYHFPYIEPWPVASPAEWSDWRWQNRNSLRSRADFAARFKLSADEEAGFAGEGQIFRVRTTPYYAEVARRHAGVRKIIMPTAKELEVGHQQMLDPLGEKKNSPAPRIIHRYEDRCLFLVTDFCSVYCRYCTRKHFTAQDQVFAKDSDYTAALNYIRQTHEIKEVILSGGDPLTLSDEKLDRILFDLRQIPHVDLIRIGSRVSVVSPMRITKELTAVFRKHKPVFFMSHFAHPAELTAQAAEALENLVDAGVPVMNQFVLLNGVNNHPNIVRALSRRLLYLRVKPYYMFQCDPSLGTDHLRTSVENSKWIQRSLWGHLSGLAMPQLSVDLPEGGGKTQIVPEYLLRETYEDGKSLRHYRGYDGVETVYVSPPESEMLTPVDAEQW